MSGGVQMDNATDNTANNTTNPLEFLGRYAAQNDMDPGSLEAKLNNARAGPDKSMKIIDAYLQTMLEQGRFITVYDFIDRSNLRMLITDPEKKTKAAVLGMAAQEKADEKKHGEHRAQEIEESIDKIVGTVINAKAPYVTEIAQAAEEQRPHIAVRVYREQGQADDILRVVKAVFPQDREKALSLLEGHEDDPAEIWMAE
jgi:hypothetical protein